MNRRRVYKSYWVSLRTSKTPSCRRSAAGWTFVSSQSSTTVTFERRHSMAESFIHWSHAVASVDSVRTEASWGSSSSSARSLKSTGCHFSSKVLLGFFGLMLRSAAGCRSPRPKKRKKLEEMASEFSNSNRYVHCIHTHAPRTTTGSLWDQAGSWLDQCGINRDHCRIHRARDRSGSWRDRSGS